MKVADFLTKIRYIFMLLCFEEKQMNVYLIT